MDIAIIVTIAWFVIWWIYAIYDLVVSKHYDYIPPKIFGIQLWTPLGQFLHVLLFPTYVLYHAILILIKFIEYLCIEVLFNMVLMGLVHIISWVLKGMLKILVRVFD